MRNIQSLVVAAAAVVVASSRAVTANLLCGVHEYDPAIETSTTTTQPVAVDFAFWYAMGLDSMYNFGTIVSVEQLLFDAVDECVAWCTTTTSTQQQQQQRVNLVGVTMGLFDEPQTIQDCPDAENDLITSTGATECVVVRGSMRVLSRSSVGLEYTIEELRSTLEAAMLDGLGQSDEVEGVKFLLYLGDNEAEALGGGSGSSGGGGDGGGLNVDGDTSTNNNGVGSSGGGHGTTTDSEGSYSGNGDTNNNGEGSSGATNGGTTTDGESSSGGDGDATSETGGADMTGDPPQSSLPPVPTISPRPFEPSTLSPDGRTTVAPNFMPQPILPSLPTLTPQPVTKTSPDGATPVVPNIMPPTLPPEPTVSPRPVESSTLSPDGTTAASDDDTMTDGGTSSGGDTDSPTDGEVSLGTGGVNVDEGSTEGDEAATDGDGSSGGNGVNVDGDTTAEGGGSSEGGGTTTDGESSSGGDNVNVDGDTITEGGDSSGTGGTDSDTTTEGGGSSGTGGTDDNTTTGGGTNVGNSSGGDGVTVDNNTTTEGGTDGESSPGGDDTTVDENEDGNTETAGDDTDADNGYADRNETDGSEGDYGEAGSDDGSGGDTLDHGAAGDPLPATKADEPSGYNDDGNLGLIIGLSVPAFFVLLGASFLTRKRRAVYSSMHSSASRNMVIMVGTGDHPKSFHHGLYHHQPSGHPYLSTRCHKCLETQQSAFEFIDSGHSDDEDFFSTDASYGEGRMKTIPEEGPCSDSLSPLSNKSVLLPPTRSLGEYHLGIDVHRCFSATCEQCDEEKQPRNQTTFIPSPTSPESYGTVFSFLTDTHDKAYDDCDSDDNIPLGMGEV